MPHVRCSVQEEVCASDKCVNSLTLSDVYFCTENADREDVKLRVLRTFAFLFVWGEFCVTRPVQASPISKMCVSLFTRAQGVLSARRPVPTPLGDLAQAATQIEVARNRNHFIRTLEILERINQYRREIGGNPIPGFLLTRRLEFELARQRIELPGFGLGRVLSSKQLKQIHGIQLLTGELEGTLEWMAFNLNRSLGQPVFANPAKQLILRQLLSRVEGAIEAGVVSYGEYLDLAYQTTVVQDPYEQVSNASENLFNQLKGAALLNQGIFPMPLRSPANPSGELFRGFGIDDFIPGTRGCVMQLRTTAHGGPTLLARQSAPRIDSRPMTDTQLVFHDGGHGTDLANVYTTTILPLLMSESVYLKAYELHQNNRESIAQTLLDTYFVTTHERGILAISSRFLADFLDEKVSKALGDRDDFEPGERVTLDTVSNTTATPADIEATIEWLRQANF